MTRASRRTFLQSSAGISAGMASGLPYLLLQSATARESGEKPNIIWIMADDLGYGDLGSYGQEKIKTPRLDQMAAEGMRFTQCYAGSTVCAPSRCSLMTGYHTGHCRVRGNKRHPLLPDDVTVAEVLKDAGYATGIVGKWGIGEPGTSGVPNRQGFDFWYGYLNQHRAHNYFPDFLWRNEEREFIFPWRYSHDILTEEGLKFVRQNKDAPFFLYMAYTIPHAFNGGGINGMPIPSHGEYGDRDWPFNQKNHAAMISLLDRDVGKLLDLLKELGIDDNTIVFFTSDNGPHREGGNDPDFANSNGPLRGIKRSMHDGGIRVPMIARWPGHIPAGVTSDQVWAFWDFLPTAADLAGAEFPDGIDGISMKNALMGEEQESHKFLYWEFHERGFHQAALMDSRWKAVRKGSPTAPIELYDLSVDIGEENNLAVQEPGIAAQLDEYLRTERSENEYYPLPE